MKRVVCLGTLLFLIRFTSCYLSKRAFGRRIYVDLFFCKPTIFAVFSISSSLAWFDGCRLTSYRNLGSAIGQLYHYPHCGLLAHRTCGPMRYMPSLMFRFLSMLLSTFDFRRRVSSCPRGFFAPFPLPCYTGISYTLTRRTVGG
jgi:hypothetical protein